VQGSSPEDAIIIGVDDYLREDHPFMEAFKPIQEPMGAVASTAAVMPPMGTSALYPRGWRIGHALLRWWRCGKQRVRKDGGSALGRG
jgi:hypothetical protein